MANVSIPISMRLIVKTSYLLDWFKGDKFISSLLAWLGQYLASILSDIIVAGKMKDNLDMALSRRKELLELIAAAADEIAAIDRYLPILYSQALEADLFRGEENALAETR